MGEAEIAELDVRRRPRLHDQHVLELHVAVKHAARVHVRQRQADLRRVEAAPLLGQRAAVHAALTAERAPLGELEEEVEVARVLEDLQYKIYTCDLARPGRSVRLPPLAAPAAAR